MTTFLKLVLGVFAAAALVACGGGGSAPAPVAVVTSDLAVPATAATVPAVVNTAFAFPSGVSSFGTTSTTTLAFTSATGTPTFKVEGDGGTATGTTTFGSCHFQVTASTFPAGHKMSVGAIITVDPCEIGAATTGATASGAAVTTDIRIQLGSESSAGVPATMTIQPDGKVTLNSTAFGTTEVKLVTGT
jgi:hypothetical protein